MRDKNTFTMYTDTDETYHSEGNLKPSLKDPFSISCLSFDINDTFSSIVDDSPITKYTKMKRKDIYRTQSFLMEKTNMKETSCNSSSSNVVCENLKTFDETVTEEENLKPSLTDSLSVSCISFDCDETFSSIIDRNCHARKVHLQRIDPINGSNSKKEADTHFVECQSSQLLSYEEDEIVLGSNPYLNTSVSSKAESSVSRPKCNTCGKLFNQNSDMKKHKERIHNKFRNFHCSKLNCIKSFYSKHDLERHTKTCKARKGYQSVKETRKILPKSILSHSLLTEKEMKQINNSAVDWKDLVLRHKTNKFGVIPLHYENIAPASIGCMKKDSQEPTRYWKLPMVTVPGSSAIIEMEANIYRTGIIGANQNMFYNF